MAKIRKPKTGNKKKLSKALGTATFTIQFWFSCKIGQNYNQSLNFLAMLWWLCQKHTDMLRNLCWTTPKVLITWKSFLKSVDALKKQNKSFLDFLVFRCSMSKKKNLENPRIGKKFSENTKCWLTKSVTIIPHDAENHHAVKRSKRIKWKEQV